MSGTMWILLFLVVVGVWSEVGVGEGRIDFSVTVIFY
jgi:hypothetical protein